MRRALLCAGCLAAAACRAPHGASAVDGPTPAIRVVPGAASRWSAALGGDADAAPPMHAARVHVMQPGEALAGPNAIGRPGDLLLENDQVVFVVDQVASSNGFAESGGNLVDLADARARRDELGQIFTYFGVFPRQAVYASMQSGTSPDGAAWIEVAGRELREPRLSVTTRYTLRAPDRALLIESTVENTADAAIALPSMGDAIQWGSVEKLAPGHARGYKGPSSGPYVGGVGRFASYAMTSTEGTIDAVNGSSWTDTALAKDVTVAPHGSAHYARVFLVGERPDTSSLVGELAQAAGAAVGEVELDLGPAASLPTGAVFALTPSGAVGATGLTLAAPFSATLPVGTYAVSLASAATAAGVPAPTDRATTVRIEAGAKARLEVRVAPAATFEARCIGPEAAPVPCKITFSGSGTTPSPDFGPGHAAGPARNQSTTADGITRVAVAPGSYRITASRGPEYTLASVDVDLSPGEERAASFVLRRVVDTRGYLACDFHQHTMLSADAPVAAGDRVVANAAEGVEVAVATEHNAIVDLEPLVRDKHLERELVEIAGDELTSDADQHPWGHANAFPLPFDASKPHGGSPPLRERAPDGSLADVSPGRVFAWVRDHAPGDRVIQINHPRSGNNGYFDLLGFDRARAAGADAAYDGGFDAIEVWNGRNVQARSKVIDDWRALLRAGHPVTPTANTDTHGIVGQEAGYPRTMVRVLDDKHLDAWDAARTADLVHGVKGLRDVVLTNGPMLRVTANGAPVGGTAKGPVVTLRVHVECAPWIDVDTVRVVRAGATADADAQQDDRKTVQLKPLPSGALAADATFDLRVGANDALFVVASGRVPMSPVLAGDDAEIRPWAMTGAVWVEVPGRR